MIIPNKQSSVISDCFESYFDKQNHMRLVKDGYDTMVEFKEKLKNFEQTLLYLMQQDEEKFSIVIGEFREINDMYNNTISSAVDCACLDEYVYDENYDSLKELGKLRINREADEAASKAIEEKIKAMGIELPKRN